jgi:hypothetical protein
MRIAAEHAHPGGAIFITPDDALGSEIRRFELQGLTGDTARSLVWRYIFAVHAARQLVANARRARRSLRKHKSIRVLRRFLKANGELPNQYAAGKLAHAVSGSSVNVSPTRTRSVPSSAKAAWGSSTGSGIWAGTPTWP